MLSQRQALEFLAKLPLLGRLGPAFLRYLLVGGLGFLADAALLEIFVRLGVSVYIARILSMTLAMGCTYALHRNFTFTDSAKPQKTAQQIVAFLVCQLIAAAANYGVFCLLLALMPQPVGFIGRMFSLCWGVGTGLAVNFVLLRLIVFPASGQPRYETLMPKSPWRIIPWLAAFGYLLRLAFNRQAEVLAWPKLDHELGPADPDIWMRLTQVRQWILGSDFFDHAVRNTNAPMGGISIHWTRPMDAMLAYLSSIVTGDTIEMHLLLAAAWLPPILGLVALLFLMNAAQKRFDHAHTVWCLLLLLALSPLTAYFMPGDADHHGFLAMLWCGVISLVMRPLNMRSAIAAGALLGVMVWVSVEALLPLAAVYAVLGWFTLKSADAIKPLAAMTIATAVTAAFGLAVEVPVANYFSFEAYDTLSIAHVVLLSFIALGAGILCIKKIRELPVALRATAALNVAVVAFLGEIGLFPKILLGPMADADFFITSQFLNVISEAKGLLSRDISTIVSHLWQPALAALLLALSWHTVNQLKKRQLLVLSALLGVSFIMTLAQGRWTYYLQPAALVAVASLLPAFAMRMKIFSSVERPFRPYACLFAIGVAVIALGSVLTPASAPSPELACQSQMRYIVQTQQLQKYLGSGPLTLYAPPELGGDILFFTPYKIIAGNYHREGEGLRALYDISRDKKPEETFQRFAERNVGAAFVCPATFSQTSWLHSLKPDRHPDWLRPAGQLRYLDIRGPKPYLFIAGNNER